MDVHAESGLSVGAISAINAIIDCVASITIRRLDDEVKRLLRIRAAEHGRSMEEEARHILRNGLFGQSRAPELRNAYEAIRSIVEPYGGFELELPPREPIREPPSFD